jgi:hypothetical protein
MWVLGIELAACHPSGALNFERDPGYLENLCSPGLVKKGKHTLQIIFFVILHASWPVLIFIHCKQKSAVAK